MCNLSDIDQLITVLSESHAPAVSIPISCHILQFSTAVLSRNERNRAQICLAGNLPGRFQKNLSNAKYMAFDDDLLMLLLAVQNGDVTRRQWLCLLQEISEPQLRRLNELIRSDALNKALQRE